VCAEVTKGALQGTSITYNDYFNESSDEGSYVESEEEVFCCSYGYESSMLCRCCAYLCMNFALQILASDSAYFCKYAYTHWLTHTHIRRRRTRWTRTL